MNVAWFARLFLFGLLALLTLTPFSVVSAAPPAFQVIPIDRTRDNTSCGYLIQSHVEGTVRIATFVDSSGAPVREIAIFPRFRITYTNPANGKSVTTPSPAVEQTKFNQDGSVTLTITGLLGRTIVPGAGVVVPDVGRLVLKLTFDDEGNLIAEEVLFEAGQWESGPYPTLCSVLA